MRNTFINELTKIAAINQNIYLVTGDLGFSVLETFIELFPDRYINAGVAEQNMTGLAAGLALSGKIVFIYSIANFPTLRCLEQIRNDICYHDANVKIVSVGSGFSYGTLGYTHYGVEDISIIRSLPKMRILSPADPIETRLSIQYAVKQNGPCYIRLGKSGEPILHTYFKFTNDFFGMMPIINEQNEVIVLATGGITAFVLEKIKNQQLNYDLWSVPILKPIDESILTMIANQTKKIITVEEHQLAGGFGSIILETLHKLHRSTKIKELPEIQRVGIENPFEDIGTQEYMREKLAFS